MRLRSIILSLTVLAAAPILSFGQLDRYAGASSTFSTANKIDVPGKTLNPGEYSIRVVDELSDRMIVRVENETTKDYAIFLGVPTVAPGEVLAPGLVDWKNGPGGATALRGFAFSPGATVEFVYPKDEAVAIATKNDATVVAVDPISAGLPPLKNMSKDQMQTIDLWALSLSAVGPNKGGLAIVAKKYQGPQIDTTQQAANKDVAAPPQQTQVAGLEQPRLDGRGDNAAATAAPAKRKPVIAKLPHTASPVAFIAFCGIFCLIAAGLFRLGAIVTNQRANNG